MPQPQQEEYDINDLLSQQRGNNAHKVGGETKKRSELLGEQMKAKKPISPIPVLRDPSTNAANTEQPADEQSDNPDQNAEQSGSQNQQPDKEEKTKKLGLLQFRKRQEVMKKLRDLQNKIDKLEKLNDKYKSTNFFFLALLSIFIEIADLPINLFWAAVILIPIAICLMLLKALASLFIYIKIHKIKNEQKTKDAWWWTLIAFVVGLIPGINILPETLLRVRQARNSAKAGFEKREDEIKKIGEEMKKLIKQLG